MQKASRKKMIFIITFSVILVITLLFVTWKGFQRMKVQNIFDEIYYAEPKSAGHSLTATRITKMQTLVHRQEQDRYPLEDRSMFHYAPDNLKTGEALGITVYFKQQALDITYTITFGENQSLQLNARYDVSQRELTYNPVSVTNQEGVSVTEAEAVQQFLREHEITSEMLSRYPQYYLVDKLATDWCAGNGDASRFTAQERGDFTIQDHISSELGADWQR